jgi:hypothetical protein
VTTEQRWSSAWCMAAKQCAHGGQVCVDGAPGANQSLQTSGLARMPLPPRRSHGPVRAGSTRRRAACWCDRASTSAACTSSSRRRATACARAASAGSRARGRHHGASIGPGSVLGSTRAGLAAVMRRNRE